MQVTVTVTTSYDTAEGWYYTLQKIWWLYLHRLITLRVG